jgi:hypothetical protein
LVDAYRYSTRSGRTGVVLWNERVQQKMVRSVHIEKSVDPSECYVRALGGDVEVTAVLMTGHRVRLDL